MFLFMHFGHILTKVWWPGLEGEVVRTEVPDQPLSGYDLSQSIQSRFFLSRIKAESALFGSCENSVSYCL